MAVSTSCSTMQAWRNPGLAGVARFLASSDSDFMTGQSLLVDGGMVFV